jgi:hypothetical protein
MNVEICLFIVLSLKYFMYRFYMVTVVYVKSTVFMYVSMYFDLFYILRPADRVGSSELEIKWKWKWKWKWTETGNWCRLFSHIMDKGNITIIYFEEWCLLGCYAVWLL